MNFLSSITILDFSRLLPGPLGTQQLRHMGARVVKVEHPERSDLARRQPPFVEGKSTLYEALNAGKEVWKLDYTADDGYRRIRERLPEFDVVVEQFRPGVMRQWKLDYRSLKKEKPDLVYISLTGYGQQGPLAQSPGHDLNYLAETGALDLIRDEKGRPVIPGFQIADIAGGSQQLVQACLAGLFHRERTGEGSFWDVNMSAGIVPLLTLAYTQHWGGMEPNVVRPLHGGLVNYNLYECADGKWIALGALEPKFWNNFCQLVDRPDWKRDNPLELAVQVFPKKELEELFRCKTREEWITLARGKQVCLSPVRSLGEARDFECVETKENGLNSLRSPLKAGYG